MVKVKEVLAIAYSAFRCCFCCSFGFHRGGKCYPPKWVAAIWVPRPDRVREGEWCVDCGKRIEKQEKESSDE